MDSSVKSVLTLYKQIYLCVHAAYLFIHLFKLHIPQKKNKENNGLKNVTSK